MSICIIQKSSTTKAIFFERICSSGFFVIVERNGKKSSPSSKEQANKFELKISYLICFVKDRIID